MNSLLLQEPDSIASIFAAAHVEARAGNYDRVRFLLEPLAEGTEEGEGQLFLRSGIHFWDPQIAAMDLAVARLQLGEVETGRALLSAIRDYYGFLKNEGLNHPLLSFQEARLLVLEAGKDKAIEVLRKAIAAGWRSWFTDGDPAFAEIQQDRQFQSLLGDIQMLVDQENFIIGTE